MDLIVQVGAVLPAVFFLKPDQIFRLCRAVGITLKALKKGFQGYPMALEGLKEAAAEYAERLAAIQATKGIVAPGLEEFESSEYRLASDLECEDVLAGDAERVFLSLGQWHTSRSESGFVYDAEVLVGLGAAVRPKDLLHHYTRFVQDVLSNPDWSDPPEAGDAIAKGLEEIRSRNEIRGSDAVGFLNGLSGAPRKVASESEVVWDGPLPVDLAVEIWKSGKEIQEEPE